MLRPVWRMLLCLLWHVLLMCLALLLCPVWKMLLRTVMRLWLLRLVWVLALPLALGWSHGCTTMCATCGAWDLNHALSMM